MDALNFLKFWRPTMASATMEISNPLVHKQEEVVDDDDDDSFFDLELFHNVQGSKTHKDEHGEIFSKRKIIPIESNSKPQSPISLLKSAPKLRVFMSKKSKAREKTELNRAYSVPVLSRDKSVRSNGANLQKHISGDSVLDSNRFSNDVIPKYMKLIKPLYIKVTKIYGDKVKLSDELSMASPAASPATATTVSKQGNILAGRRIACKNLGKSKSASAAIGARSPAASRRDDSLLQQHDGIQSAILHCKRSFNSSRDSINDPFEKMTCSARNSSENGSGVCK